MCSLDMDPCTIWAEQVRTARAPHRCAGCDTDIKPGDPYLDHNDLFEGKWSHEAACVACTLARDAFAEAHGQAFAPSFLVEMLRECVVEREHDEDGWRDLLAIVLRRHRVSQVGRKRLRSIWDYAHERKARHAAWLALGSLAPAALSRREG